MKRKFYTVADVEALARSSKKELVLGPDDRVTPLAWERARELGIELRSSQPPSTTPPGYTYPPADEAHQAFLEKLTELERDLIAAPVLARVARNVIRAADRGDAIIMPSQLQLATHGLSWTRKRELEPNVRILIIWAHRLFGPRSTRRRFDILWALEELRTCLSNPS